MADPINYSGVTYNPDYYQGSESFPDFIQRLAANRAGGVLGGGGMLDTPAAKEITSTPLGQEVQSCPAGYVLRNGACVPASQGGSGGNYQELREAPTNEERYKGARTLLDNPLLAAGVRAVMPLGTGNLFLSDNQLEGYVRNEQNEATKSQGFLDYLMGNDGDQVLANTGTNSLATGQASTSPYNKNTPYTGSYFTEVMNTVNNDIFDPRSAADARTARQAGVTVSATPMPQLPTLAQEAQLQRTMGMMDTLSQLNSGSTSGGNSGYYSDSSGSYTGGSDYGGWTGVTSDGSGNDWDSFGGDDTY